MPMCRSTADGLIASTASALASSAAIQPGPLSAQAMSTMSERAIPRLLATRSAVGSSTGPLRTSAGAAKASPPSARRTVLVLRYYLDLPEAEVAAILGWRIGTVKSATHRALRDLRRVLE